MMAPLYAMLTPAVGVADTPDRLNDDAALELVTRFNTLGRDAAEALALDEVQFTALLAERERILATLTGHLDKVRRLRPPADHPMVSRAQNALDAADAHLDRMLDALDGAMRSTATLTAKVSSRVNELRSALSDLERGSRAAGSYQQLAGITGQINARR